MFEKLSRWALDKRHKSSLKMRALSKRQYIIRHGVLGWGLTTGIFFTLWQTLVDHNRDYAQPWFILLNTLGWGIGGYFWGLFTWSWMQKRKAANDSNRDS